MMGKSKKGAAKKQRAKPKKERHAPPEAVVEEPIEKKPSAVDQDALRRPVEEAKAALDAAEADAKQVTEKAQGLVAAAKATYIAALGPYREACRRAGVACQLEGSRGKAVSEKVFFEVERVGKGVRVMIKGKPESEEVIPLSALKESVGKAAYAYTEKHLGSREQVGNKGGTLANRLRTALAR
jgi:hypothetical protein